MLDINPEDLKSPHALQQAEKRFEWSINFLIVNFRFVHQVLGMLVKICEPRIETMGVCVIDGSRMELRYNPAFTNALTDEELVYVLFHEVLHLVLHHCTARRFSNPQIGNIATDLAVNELIPVKPGSCDIPKDKDGKIAGCLVSEMKKQDEYKDIEERQTAEWYYDYLMAKAKKQGGKGKGKGKDPQSMGDKHDGWKEDELADEKIRAKVDELDKNELWGNESQTFKEAILAAQVRRINWRSLIRRFVGNIVWKDRECTRKRPNRRTGYTHPGYKKTYVDRVLVAVDTSGSVSSSLLAQFLGVLNGLSESMPLDLMQFDCSVTEEPKPFNQHRKTFDFKGRGGTDFEPVIQLAMKRRYRAVIIQTDGQAAACTKPPATMQVLWVLPMGCTPPVEWGERVYLKEHV